MRDLRDFSVAFAALAVVTVLPVSACSNDAGTTQRSATGTAATGATTSSVAVPVTRPSCIVPEPPQWKAAIEGSRIDTGGVSTIARAVAPGGEVLAVRDTGDTRDLILIGTDKSVRDVYAVPEPNTFDIGYGGIDDRWIVFALVHIPRNSNGVLPTIRRIEIIDRADGSVRTVATQSEADQSVIPELNVLDSVALHDGRVYWLTRDTYSSDTGTVRSFDPGTGATTDVESGPMRDLRAGAGGVSWAPSGPGRNELRLPAELPEELTAVADADRVSLGTDGAAFGWIVGVEQGGTGVGYWSPESGVVTVTGLELKTDDYVPPVLVHGPFVLVDKGFGAGGSDSSGIVVDTRSGAVTGLERRADAQYDRAVAAADGVLALDVWSGPGKGDYSVGVLGRDALTPLDC